MEILQPYNNDTLQLISDNTDYIFTESDLQNGKIKKEDSLAFICLIAVVIKNGMK